ncbi:MAG: hypothetical protein K0Q87_3998, partial [Neobacillus sp.]|nr:hypothetical protein [Neobacillus sp.]
SSRIQYTTIAASNANMELQIITKCQFNEEKNITTKWGKDDPRVNAAIKIPIASPRFFGNHCDNIFTAIGYTPARVIPVNILSKIPKKA